MRVLWLTSVQLPAVTGEPAMTGCGWLEGLRAALAEYAPDLELGIASWGSVAHPPLERHNATYFSLAQPEPGGRVRRAAERWRHDFIPRGAIVEAVRVSRRFAPDVLHVHGTEHQLGLAAPAIGRPTVASLQGIASTCTAGMLTSIPCGEIARDSLTRRFLRGNGYLHAAADMSRRAAAERRIIAGITHFTGQTEWDEMVLRLLSPHAVYHRCTRVLQPAFYAPQPRVPSDVPTLVCTSSAAPYKGLETLLTGVRLAAEATAGELRLHVAGALTDTTIWPFLQRLTRRLDLQDTVSWVGRLHAAALIREIAACSAFVLPSHIENESNALLEAMLIGVPCIAAASGGVPEVLRHGRDGLLYHDTDPFELAAALVSLLEHPERGEDLAQGARQRALDLTDPRRGADDMMRVYDAILAGSATARRR